MKDLQLLKNLYLIECNWKDEHKMINFILNYCHKELKDSNIIFELDHYGNLFITKNTNNSNSYVCVIAHMDTVQKYQTSRKIFLKEDKISAIYENGKSAGLGADELVVRIISNNN